MVVQGASTGAQRIETSKLNQVVEDCRHKQLKPPALVVVGQVVQHRTLAGTPLQPLAGKRILVTCCPREMESVCAILRDRGAEPLPYPTYRLEDCQDTETWTRFAAIASAGGWCVFASETEVQTFCLALLRNNLDFRSLGKLKIAAFGAGAKSALLQKGIRADISYPSPHQTLSLSDLNCGAESIPANLVLLSKEMPMDASDWEEIIEMKLVCAKPAAWEPHWEQEVQNNPPELILFNNPAAVDGYVHILGQATARSLAMQSKVIVTSETTAQAARRSNLPFIVDGEFLQSACAGADCVLL
jgi:uroporphyrinogen III methyltransferase/synthase